jgi:hypothetical protein
MGHGGKAKGVGRKALLLEYWNDGMLEYWAWSRGEPIE